MAHCIYHYYPVCIWDGFANSHNNLDSNERISSKYIAQCHTKNEESEKMKALMPYDDDDY